MCRNIGYPLNTVNDDVFFVPTLDGSKLIMHRNTTTATAIWIFTVTILGGMEQIAVLSDL